MYNTSQSKQKLVPDIDKYAIRRHIDDAQTLLIQVAFFQSSIGFVLRPHMLERKAAHSVHDDKSRVMNTAKHLVFDV